MKSTSERMRIRYKYRRKILTGEIRVSRECARRLIGPDCAYHLYGVREKEKKGKGKVSGARHAASRVRGEED